MGVRSPERRAGALAALPGLLVLVAGVALAVADGGFAAAAWYPTALALLALAAVVLVVGGPRGPRPARLYDAALALFALYVLFGFASILWAGDRGAAWDGANRALLYLVVLFIAGTVAWTERALRLALTVVGGGLAVVAAVVLISLAAGDSPADSFLEGRLAAPIDYANATAALWLIGFFAAAALAAARGLAWPLRGLALGAATLLAQCALLSQSRGALVGFVVAAIAFVAVSPRRWPALLALAVPVGLTALGFDTLTDVRAATTTPALEAALDDALVTVARSVVVAVVLGAAAALAGPRLPEAVRDRRAARAGNLAIAALGAAAVVAVLVAVGSPGPWLDDRWQDFKTSYYSDVEAGENRFGGSLGSGRYDFWRVALNEFRENPIAGIGQDNFAVPYLQHRRTPEAPRYPHSLAFRQLSQGGLVGTALFLAWLVLMLVCCVRAARRSGATTRALAAGAFCSWLAWFTHGQADWLWEFPALGTLALALLAMAARAGDEVGEVGEPGPALRPARSTVLAAGAVGLVAAGSLAAPGIAARYTSAAYADYTSAPQRTLARLDRAADFNPLSAEAPLAHGLIARRLGRPQEARAALAEAVERHPDGWFGHFELALLDAQEGDPGAALASAERALELNPRQPLLAELRSRLRAGERVDAAELERQLYGQLERRLRPTQGE